MEINNKQDISNKIPLENLSKEDLIKKCKNLLGLAQRAKQTKDSLNLECNELKEKLNNIVHKNEEEAKASTLLIENLTQQKLNLFITVEELKKQQQNSDKKLKLCQLELSETKIQLDNLDTENQSHVRQVKRLSDENEELITHLDRLEKDIQELKKTNIADNANENCLEEKNLKIIELQSMLACTLEEVKKFQEDVSILNEENKSNISVINEKDKVIAELDSKCIKFNEELLQKNKIIDRSTNEMDDLNTELHKNRAIIEKLHRDVSDTKSKLNENQITGSQVTGDLENTNEKLKLKLKSYRLKIIKIAGDIKVLKQTKENLLSTIGESMDQVQKWKEQLTIFNDLFTKEMNDSVKEKQCLINELNEAKQSVENIQSEKEQININLEEMKTKLLSYENQNSIMDNNVTQINCLQNEKERLLDELKVFKLQLEELENKNLYLSEEVIKEKHKYEEENKQKLNCEKKIKDFENELANLKNMLRLRDEKVQNVQKHIETLQEKLDRAEIKYQDCNQQYEIEKQCQLKSIKLLNDVIDKDKEKIAELLNKQQKNEENERELSKANEELNEITTQLKTSRRENSELLTEMNEMNEVLKERGETISKQQQYCEDILNKLEIYEKQLSEANKYVEALADKDNKIKELEATMRNMTEKESSGSNITDQHTKVLIEKDSKIKELEMELDNLKEKLNQTDAHETSYAESECMSTSTVSRMDEVSRLKDLEGSWEERYGKLRNLALKLKGKVKEQTAQLSQEQNEKVELQNKIVSLTKNMQILQTQCDEVQDKFENSKQETKNLSKLLETSAQDLSNDKNALATNIETISVLQMELENIRLEKKTLENSNKILLSQIQSLKNENEFSSASKREFENKISKLEKDVLSRDKAINEEIDKHKATKTQLQELSKECKSKSVLNLEMQDFERSVKDLTQKLEKRQELVNDLQSTADSQQHTISILREEIRLLEDRILNEESDLTNARIEISTVKKQLSDTESLISQKDNRIHEVMQSLENCRGENETINAQMAKVISDNQKIYETMKNEKEQYKIKVLSLEQMLNEVKEILKIRNDELDTVRKEYEGYKIRAQSVLRQNQTRDVGLEERLNEEVTNLRGKIISLEEQLKELKSKYEELKLINNVITVEKNTLSSKIEEIMSQLEVHKHNFTELEMRYQQTIADNAEAVRSLKVHADTLAQCYRQQISEQELSHSEELKELRALLEKTILPPEENPYTPPPMPREECEGSESIESGNFSNVIQNPLEKLLNSSGDVESELVTVKEQLVQHEARLKHLTGLLSDAEQDLAKHVQMNQLLKEEIRRQQRSVEREQHAENLEYLKNVVVKFITLNNGDERNRLIPVLNTILKLSPEETRKLVAVVNGDPNNRGWGSYLPIWNSPK